MENKAYIVSYLGDKPPTAEDIGNALLNAEIDEEGILEVEETKPTQEICEYCNGCGNEGTMANIDCGNCGGTGWSKKTK